MSYFPFGTSSLRARIWSICLFVLLMNAAVWIMAAGVFHANAVLMGSAVLAFSLGLRHGVDADHIAAIDNATRKLMQDGKRPVAVGLFFSLGHSTLVFALSALLAATAAGMKRYFAAFEQFGSVFGVALSSGFLFVLAAINIYVLVAIVRSFRRVKRGEPYEEEDLSLLLMRRGLLGRVFSRLFRLVGRSWHLYPIGILFGLGFDTATEVGLLGMSTAQSAHGLDIWKIMLFPALFTAGMSLVDTADNILMLSVYDWAFLRPLRKLYYNITITGMSVVVAVLVGGIEALGLFQGLCKCSGQFWQRVAAVDGNAGTMGYGIIVLFALSWILSMLFYRLQGYDRIEVTIAQ